MIFLTLNTFLRFQQIISSNSSLCIRHKGGEKIKTIPKSLLLATLFILTAITTFGAVAAADQPDLQISNGTTTVGNDVYNSDGASQTVNQTVRDYAPVDYQVTIQNNGTSTDNIVVTGTASGNGWTIQYLDALNNDITADVIGLGRTFNLIPGQSSTITARISAGPNVAIGAIKDILVTATSTNDNTKTDVVKATTTYTGGTYDTNIGGLVFGPNDDSYSGAIALPFTFNFYGTDYNNIYVNNNGYVFFNNPYGYWHLVIPQSDRPFVAAFVSDIYTYYGGTVHYNVNSERAVITWDRVASISPSYYGSGYNTFQVILNKDGRIIFSYGDMQWGSASFAFNQGDGAQYVLQSPGNVNYQTYWFTNSGQQVPQADISVAKEARVNGGAWQNINPNTINTILGDNVEFRVTVTNNGPGAAPDVRISDLIPSGLQNVVVTPPAGTTYDQGTGVWSIGNLALNTPATLLISGTINQSNTLITNNASRVDTIGYVDPNPANDADNEILNVNSQADVYMEVSSSKTDPKVGEDFVITVKVGNKGPDAAKNVVVTYKLPEGMEYVGLTSDAGYPAPQYDAATRTVTWNLGDLPVIDPAMYITVRALNANDFVNSVELTTDSNDPVNSNNIGTVTVNAAAATEVNAATKTIAMQKTGVPLAYLVLAVLLILGGLVGPQRK